MSHICVPDHAGTAYRHGDVELIWADTLRPSHNIYLDDLRPPSDGELRAAEVTAEATRQRLVRQQHIFFKTVQEHVYNTTVPAICLPHTGFAGVWTPATHAEFSNST